MSKPKYDKNTLNQLKDIDQDKGIKDNEMSLKTLEERIKVLEDARQVQIRLNQQFTEAITKKANKPEEETKSILDYIFKR